MVEIPLIKNNLGVLYNVKLCICQHLSMKDLGMRSTLMNKVNKDRQKIDAWIVSGHLYKQRMCLYFQPRIQSQSFVLKQKKEQKKIGSILYASIVKSNVYFVCIDLISFMLFIKLFQSNPRP